MSLRILQPPHDEGSLLVGISPILLAAGRAMAWIDDGDGLGCPGDGGFPRDRTTDPDGTGFGDGDSDGGGICVSDRRRWADAARELSQPQPAQPAYLRSFNHSFSALLAGHVEVENEPFPTIIPPEATP